MARSNPEIIQTTTKADTWASATGYSTTYKVADVWNRSFAGVKTPGFPNVQPLPENDYTLALRQYWPGYHYSERVIKATGVVNGWRKGHPTPYVSMSSPTFHITDAEMVSSDADRKARSRAIADVQRLKANIAQDIAEYKQVRNLFVANARRIALGLRALKRGDFKTAWEHIPLRERHKQSLLRRGPLDIRRRFPETVLEINYGIRPLMGSVHSALTEFYQRVEEGYEIRSVGTGTSTGSDRTSHGSASGYIDVADFNVWKHRCKYVMYYEVDNAYLANLDDWGITNPVLLAWELLPWSFVYDWFLPVGSWLEQVNYQLGLTFKRGSVTRTSNKITKRSIIPAASTPTSTTFNRAYGYDTFQTTRLRRTRLTSFPSPGRPKFDPEGLRGMRVLNALALLATAFDRKPPRKL